MAKLLAIVPARGGSKRLPGKNIKELCGKPLINWTLETVSQIATTTILTSDSEAILNIGSKVPGVAPLLRKKELASDTSTVLETVIDIVETVKSDDYDIVGLFLPTAPLRALTDISNALDMLRNPNLDGVVSTTDYEFPPTLGLVRDKDGLIYCSDPSNPFITGNTRSQDHNFIIRPNGAIYLRKMAPFIRDKNFFKGKVANYHMAREASVDIDTILDFKLAQIIINGCY